MFGKLPTVDDVMKNFHKTIEGLQNVIDIQIKETESQSAIIAKAEDERYHAAAEAERAVRIKEKLEALFD